MKNENYALKILHQAREREQLLMETELQNSEEPEVHKYAQRIEQLGEAIDILIHFA